jgi:hypothetical protein
MMPVATVAREPRRFETQNSPDLTGTELGYQLVKAWTFHRATRRATQVIINDLNVRKTMGPCDFHQIILPPLAFEVLLHLGIR